MDNTNTHQEENETEYYKVMVDDNFDFMDEDGRHCAGRFKTYEEALEVAKSIVLKSLANAQGSTAEEIYDHYTSFGDDPFIMPHPWRPPADNAFSAWKFAKQEAGRIARERTEKK